MWKMPRSFNLLENQEIINLMFYKSMQKNREMEHPKMFSASCRRLLMVGIGILIWIMLTPPLVFGQQNGKLISLKLDKVTVLDAIKEINRLSGNSVSYKREELEKEARQVSLELKDVQAIKAVEAVLQGTRLVAMVHGETILIVPRKDDANSNVKSVRLKGFVYDTQNLPMPGVTVKVAGLAIGAATNEKGWFALDLPLGNGTLEFSFVGFKKKVINFNELTAKDTLRVTLEEDIQALDETIVVAYGETTRRKSTGSVSVVKADEMKGIPTTSIASLLQGRVAGMDITQMSGSPGGGGTAVIIRGYNSLDVEQGRRFSDPLWVVDGVPMNSFTSPISGTNLLSDLNPEMIESVQVLKDASAASIYGSRAANGVILVTTKKGKKNQKANFAVNFSQTWSVLPELLDVTIGRAERLLRLQQAKNKTFAYLDPKTNQYKYPESLREQYENSAGGAIYDKNFSKTPGTLPGSSLQDSLNPFYNNATNYFPVYYVKGKVTNANIQTYGGGENMSYGIGLGYYKEDGVFRGTGYNRVDLTSSMNVIPVKRLNVDMRFNASLANRKRATKSEILGSSAPSVEVVPGEPLELNSFLPGEGSVPWNTVLDAYDGTKEKNRNIRLRANFKVGYEPIDGLDITAMLATDYSIDRRNYFEPSYLSGDKFSTSMGETGVNLMVLSENLISYKRTIKEDHSLSFVGGFSYQYDQVEYNGGSARNSPSDKIYYAPNGLPVLGTQMVPDIWGGSYEQPIAFQRYISTMQEKSLVSYFARLEYDFRGKYMVSASFRRDGSSTFGADNRWGTFPSVAAAWTFSEENWIKDNWGWLSFGKLRASWGRSGMHFSQCYLALGELNLGGVVHGNSFMSANVKGGMYNPALSWEETDQYDFGLDVDLFNYRLTITADYYYRYTDKMLAEVSLQGAHSGYASQWQNAMAISNEGVEVMIKYDIFREEDLYWKISVNGARNWNRFQKSYNGRDYGKRVIGKPLNGLYALETNGFVDSYDELKLYHNAAGMGYYLTQNEILRGFMIKKGEINYVDVNGDGVIDNKDQMYIGSTLPEISGGIVNEFRWKNFDLNMLFSYSLGRHAVNSLIRRSVEGAVTPLLFNPDKVTFWEKPGDKADYGVVGSSAWLSVDGDVEKVNYLRLKSLTVGYSLPRKWLRKTGMTELRLFVSGENLLTWTNYSGLDPETIDLTSGYDHNENYPLPRKYTLGITLKF